MVFLWIRRILEELPYSEDRYTSAAPPTSLIDNKEREIEVRPRMLRIYAPSNHNDWELWLYYHGDVDDVRISAVLTRDGEDEVEIPASRGTLEYALEALLLAAAAAAGPEAVKEFANVGESDITREDEEREEATAAATATPA